MKRYKPVNSKVEKLRELSSQVLPPPKTYTHTNTHTLRVKRKTMSKSKTGNDKAAAVSAD